MHSELGQTEVGELGVEGFEKLYNNHIRFTGAFLNKTSHPVYGSVNGETVYHLVIQLGLDEFDIEHVSGVGVNDDGQAFIETTEKFPWAVDWLIGEFFVKESFDKMGKYAKGEWNLPSLITVTIWSPNLDTFEEDLVWLARFSKSDYENFQKSKIDYEGYIERAQERNDRDYALLVKEFGE